MKIKPLGDRVLVKMVEMESKTAGGLYIPQTAQEKTCLLYTSDAADD